MSDPLRWTDPESEATTLERVLIQGEATVGPSEQVVSGVWSKLSASLPPVAVGVGVTASAKAAQAGVAAKTAASGSAGFGLSALAKPLILGIALGGGSVVVSHEIEQSTVAEPPSAVAPLDPAQRLAPNAQRVTRQAPASEPPPESPRGEPSAEDGTQQASRSEAAVSAGAKPEPAPPREPESRASRLAEERKRLVEARALLRSGRAGECLALLDSNAGVGLLGQERLVIRVEALMMLGRKAEAKQLAAGLIAKHPESPYAPYLSRITR